MLLVFSLVSNKEKHENQNTYYCPEHFYAIFLNYKSKDLFLSLIENISAIFQNQKYY